MRIYVCHSLRLNFVEDLYRPLRESSLATRHEFIFPHENSEQPVHSQELIKSCDFVLAEVSVPSTGVGIELGWASAFEIPIRCVHKASTQPSASLRFVTNDFVEYQTPADLVAQLDRSL